MAKTKVESFRQVNLFFAITEDIGSLHKGLLQDGNRIWNLDQTNADPEYGKKIKVFCDAGSATMREVKHLLRGLAIMYTWL